MVNLIEAITKGIELFSFFNSKYYGSIKFRPLTNLECQHVMAKAFNNVGFETKKFIQDIKFRHTPSDHPGENFMDEINHARTEMDIWVVYHAVKDFQGDRWESLDTKGIPLGYHLLTSPECSLEIPKFANEILTLTTRPRDEVRTIIETKGGKQLAHAVWNMNVPLTDKLWKLTDLQITFIVESSKGKRKYTSAKEILEKEGFKPIKLNTPEEKKLIDKLERIRHKLR